MKKVALCQSCREKEKALQATITFLDYIFRQGEHFLYDWAVAIKLAKALGRWEDNGDGTGEYIPTEAIKGKNNVRKSRLPKS